MKFVSRFANWVAVTAISLTVIAFVVDGTLLNTPFTNQAAKDSGFFDGLSSSLPQLFTDGLQGKEQTDAKLALSYVLTPAYIQKQWEVISAGWDQHYRSRAPLPKLNLADITRQAESAGFKLPDELSQQFERPPALQEIPFLAGLYNGIRWLKLFGIPLSLLCLVSVWVVAQGKHFLALAKVFTGVAVGLGTTYLFLAAAPGLISGSLSSNQDLKTLAGPLTKYLQAIFSATNQRFITFIMAFAIAAAICLILSLISRFFPSRRGGGTGPARPIQKFHPSDKG